MAKGLFFKLARENIARNRRLYAPYAGATAIMAAMFFIILNTIYTQGISSMRWSATLIAVLNIGLVVMGIFTAVYMLYLNSFMLKQRKKEFGLYAILGLEKRHVGRIILIEGVILNGLSLAAGLIIGTVFGRLFFMLLLAVMNVAGESSFELSLTPYLITAVFFMAIFLACTVYNQLSVRLANPIGLLYGEKSGEKRLKGVALLSILGLLCLGAGYYCSLSPTLAPAALVVFWPAVVLVIVGTNLLFLAGSQFILSRIKRNKRLYYRPRWFVSVSGLSHRLKQNAAGLSNICILSTMVLVTLSMVFSLYFGQENALQTLYRNDFSVAFFVEGGQPADYSDFISYANSQARRHNVTMDTTAAFNRLQVSASITGGQLTAVTEGRLPLVEATIISLDDYNAITGSSALLADGELLLLFESPELITTSKIGGYRIKSVLSGTYFTQGSDIKNDMVIRAFIVAASPADCLKISAEFEDSSLMEPQWATVIDLNFTGSEQDRLAFANELVSHLFEIGLRRSQSSYDLSRSDFYALYGGLLFMGILFSALFMVNTVVIMYFKQVSEGYEDRERYKIMRNVGMSDSEVRKTINSQVLIVFFAPLAVAVMHIFAATAIMTNILRNVAMTNNSVTAICIAAITAVYAVLYVFVFKITARSYYKIVK